MAKRTADIILSTVLIVILAPVFPIVALLVRMKLGPKVLFAQERVGLNERLFTIYKFRTMTFGRDASGLLLPDEERLTPLGKFLRLTSIDELAELFNVLKGDMSLVGPRPLFERYLPYYTEEEKKRFTMHPGITGWAQVHGRNDVPWDERLKLDVWYVDNWSFALDMKILFMTAIKMLKGEGIQVSPGSVMLDLDEERKRNVS